MRSKLEVGTFFSRHKLLLDHFFCFVEVDPNDQQVDIHNPELDSRDVGTVRTKVGLDSVGRPLSPLSWA